MKKINSIFVYGSLQRGMQNYHLLKDFNGTWKKGYVTGTFINIGKGENYGFPAIKLDDKGSKIFFSSGIRLKISKPISELEND